MKNLSEYVHIVVLAIASIYLALGQTNLFAIFGVFGISLLGMALTSGAISYFIALASFSQDAPLEHKTTISQQGLLGVVMLFVFLILAGGFGGYTGLGGFIFAIVVGVFDYRLRKDYHNKRVTDFYSKRSITQ